MKNRHILEKLANLKKKDCIHPIFNFFVFNKGAIFLLSSTVPNCRTMGCLAGELPGLDPDWYFSDSGRLYYKNTVDTIEALEEYFDLPRSTIFHIFYANSQQPESFGGKMLSGNTTLKNVQKNLKIFLKRYAHITD